MSVAAVERAVADEKGACITKDSESPRDSQRKESPPNNLKEKDDSESMQVYFERNRYMFQGP